MTEKAVNLNWNRRTWGNHLILLDYDNDSIIPRQGKLEKRWISLSKKWFGLWSNCIWLMYCASNVYSQ